MNPHTFEPARYRVNRGGCVGQAFDATSADHAIHVATTLPQYDPGRIGSEMLRGFAALTYREIQVLSDGGWVWVTM